MTFISMHSIIICVVFSSAYMRCTRLCYLNPGVTQEDLQLKDYPHNDAMVISCVIKGFLVHNVLVLHRQHSGHHLCKGFQANARARRQDT
jgi:hypothetical protein